MSVKTIQGKLFTTNAEAAACPFVRVRLYWSFTQAGLKELVTSGTRWDESGISFYSRTSSEVNLQAVKQFVSNLNEVLKTEDAVRLGLRGAFSVEISTYDNHQIFNVRVADSNATYGEAKPV